MSSCRILYHHRIRADDGQAVHVREMIAALRSAGHEVLECALVPKAGGAVASNGDAARRAPGFWQRLNLPRFLRECAEILYTGKGRSMILQAAADFRPDFIYERYALHCRSGLLASRALGVPLLLEVNSPMCDEMDRLKMLRFERIGRQTERDVLSGADRVLAVSDVLAERLIAIGADPAGVRVIRNGAEPGRFGDRARQAGRDLMGRIGLTDQDFIVGFLGYMRDWHRLDRVIDAMRRIGNDRLHFVIAGDGPALPALRERAAAAGLADRVRALGEVPGAEIPAVCSIFDVALIPAINEYASPLKMFDSLAAGVATLAVDQPNIRELITDGQTGVLFDPADPDSLVRQLEQLVQDPARSGAIGVAGRESLLDHEWTWAGNVDRVIGAYEELR